MGLIFIAFTMLYYTLSATADYDNELQWYVLYSRAGPAILGPAENAMPWVYCYLPIMLN